MVGTMDPHYLGAVVIVGTLAFTVNCLNLANILKNFDISTHVFTLIFVDALISLSCSVAMSVIGLSLMQGSIENNFYSCSAVHSGLLPSK